MADLLRWLARFARLVVQDIRRSCSKSSPIYGAERTEAMPTTDRYTFVLERVKAYRDEMLSYEIGLERHRRSASREALGKALALDNELPESPVDAGALPEFGRVGLGSTAASTSDTLLCRRAGPRGSRRRERAKRRARASNGLPSKRDAGSTAPWLQTRGPRHLDRASGFREKIRDSG